MTIKIINANLTFASATAINVDQEVRSGQHLLPGRAAVDCLGCLNVMCAIADQNLSPIGTPD